MPGRPCWAEGRGPGPRGPYASRQVPNCTSRNLLRGVDISPQQIERAAQKCLLGPQETRLRVPEWEVAAGLVLVDVRVAAGAEHVLPGRVVARAVRGVRGERGRVALREPADEGGLERPQVGVGRD